MSAALTDLILVVVGAVTFAGVLIAFYGDRRERDRDTYRRASDAALRRELARHDHPSNDHLS